MNVHSLVQCVRMIHDKTDHILFKRPYLHSGTFAVPMISRPQATRFPTPGPWRDTLAADPPFTTFRASSCIYNLGSGGKPFVTRPDHDLLVPKAKQRYRCSWKKGATIGAMIDARAELFKLGGKAHFVKIESLGISSKVLREHNRIDSSRAA